MKIMATIWRRVLSLFRRKRTHDEPAAKPKARDDDAWTMSELLERLDKEHERYALKHSRYSGISKGDRKSLLRMGPFVVPAKQGVYQHQIPSGSVFSNLVGMSPPAQIFIGYYQDESLIEDHPDTDELATPVNVFAFRDSDCPISGLQKTPGIRYRVGVGVAFTDGTEINVATYATVDFDTGKIWVPKMLRERQIILPRPKNKNRHQSVYAQKTREICNHKFFNEHEDAAERMIKKFLEGGLSLWAKRDTYYQVATRKGKGRVTFGVKPGEQVAFFRDREKTALASDGKRKRIVHFVRGHDRVRDDGAVSQVKEHLRGIRRFTWNGFDVSVTVPKFHVTSYDFSAPPVDAQNINDDREYLKPKQLSEMLADAEDHLDYGHGEQAAQ